MVNTPARSSNEPLFSIPQSEIQALSQEISAVANALNQLALLLDLSEDNEHLCPVGLRALIVPLNRQLIDCVGDLQDWEGSRS